MQAQCWFMVCPNCGDCVESNDIHCGGTMKGPNPHEAQRAPTYCPAQTYRQTRDNPAEYCDEEVSEHGDLCASHEEDDRADEQYDSYVESLRKE